MIHIFDKTAVLDHEFIKYPLPFSKKFAKCADLSIVTNKSHYDLLKENNAEVLVVSDIPFEDNK